MSASPAEALTGLVLEGGWIVGERLDPPGGTGGCFSVRYLVTNDLGELAFLKALDISRALHSSSDLVTALNELTSAYEFERELVIYCAEMSRIVRGIAYGQAKVPSSVVGPVPYIILNLRGMATCGAVLTLSGPRPPCYGNLKRSWDGSRHEAIDNCGAVVVS